MAKVRSNEILEKALPTDPGAIPRFDIKAPDGSVLASDVTLELKNKVLQSGMPVDKQAIDECLAASGAVYGDKKALVLDQENFVLFDGAPVRIKLFDTLSGACTLNVNETGAKRIKTSSGEDPDGFIKDMWVDLVYSTDKDQYVIIGGSAAYSLGANINILEEVESMKFCKVVTPDSGEQDSYSEWLRLGVLTGICETENYRWYARLCEAQNVVEFLRVSKSSGAADYFTSPTFSVVPFPAMYLKYVSRDTSYGVTATGKLQLIPVRNGDCILFAAITGFYSQDGNGSNVVYVNTPGIMVGVVFPDLNVYADVNLIQNKANSDRNNGLAAALCTQIGLLNGYLSDDGSTLFYSGFSAYTSFSTTGARMFPGVLRALNTASHTLIWEHAGTNKPTASIGRAVWVLNETKALWFAGWNSSAAGYAAGYMSFSKAAAPTQETTIGSSATWQGLLSVAYKMPFCTGWYVSSEGSEVGIVGFDQYGSGGSTPANGGCAKLIAVNHISNSIRTVSRTIAIENSRDQNTVSWFCLPGYADKPYIFFTGSVLTSAANAWQASSQLLRRETAAAGISLDQLGGNIRVPVFTDCFAIYDYARGTQYDTTYILGSALRIADFLRKSGCFTGATGIVTFSDGTVASVTASGIIWHCEEDGVYKFIMVGGGGPGSMKKAGNAGSLAVACCYVAAGTDVLISPGHGGASLPDNYAQSVVGADTNASEVSMGPGAAGNTTVTVGDKIFLATGAREMQSNGPGAYGGINGDDTRNDESQLGGGAGGYDLTIYGGSGIDFQNNQAFMPDRNGGRSSATGTPSGGTGYGAGGTRFQPGSNGCVVIIR